MYCCMLYPAITKCCRASPLFATACFMEDMEDEEEEEGHMVLPDTMWSVMCRLLPESTDGLLGRLTIHHQLAHTAYSSVFTAILDGAEKVIVKVCGDGWSCKAVAWMD